MIQFASPLLLALTLPVVVIVVLRLRNLPLDHQGARRRVIQVVMVLATVVAGLALAGLELEARRDRLAVVYVLDRSRSVERSNRSDSTKVMDEVQRSLKAIGPDDKAGLVVFAAAAATEVAITDRPAFGAVTARIPRDQTDIAGGIRRALAELPADHSGRIIVISDGVATGGDTIRAASLAAGRGVEIDVFPLEREPEPEVALEGVHVPPAANPGEPVDLRLITRSTSDTEVSVRVMRDGQPLAQGQTKISAGRDVLTLRDVPPEPGTYRYSVVLEPLSEGHDSARENNEGSALIRVLGTSAVLILAEEPRAAAPLVEAFRNAGLEPELRGPGQVPTGLTDIAHYDLIVLSDFSARNLSEEQMNAIAAAVEHLGSGLLMLGSRRSFGLGGYSFTPIERVLPASFALKQRRDRASLAMVIAIDRSGSMMAEVPGGRMKLDLANEAAARSAKLLSPLDRVGVMHVDTEVTWTIPMSAVEAPEQIARKIYDAQPGGGGIFVDITLRSAYRSLLAEKTQLRHLLLFSDGADSENMEGTQEMVRGAFSQGITTSVVSMGTGADTPELEVLSRLGEGRFFIVDDLRELPAIFTQETFEASRSALVEEPFRPIVVATDDVIRGLDFRTAPPLGGYAIVNRRPRSTVVLAASEEDPLLLLWQRGLGRSAVLATDGGSRLARSWLSWPGYMAFFGQLANELGRSPQDGGINVRMTTERGLGKIRVEAIDRGGRMENYLDLTATVVTPTGQSVEISLSQVGAALYEGTFDASIPGAYLAGINDSERGIVGNATLVSTAGDELRGEGTDLVALAQLAALTGGEVREDLEGVFFDRPPPTVAYIPLWRYLLEAALLLLILSVALRRLYISGEAFKKLVPRPIIQLLGRDRRRRVDPKATIDALSARQATARKRTPKSKKERRVSPGKSPDHAPMVSPIPKQPASHIGRPEAQEGGIESGMKETSSLAEKLLERKKRQR